MKNTLLFTLFLAGIAMVSCNKAPGEGGFATIRGKIYIYKVNGTFTDTLEEYYGFEERVYLVYGSADSTYDADFRTSFDGSFEFNYLTPGQYTIFGYSECAGCGGPGHLEYVDTTVTITDKKETIDVGNIYLIKK